MVERRTIGLIGCAIAMTLALDAGAGPSQGPPADVTNLVPNKQEVGHPYEGVVALINANSPQDSLFHGQFCGGALISPTIVVTAAHCVFGRTAPQVLVADHVDDLCSASWASTSKVTAIDTMPGSRGEVAVLSLAEASHVQPLERSKADSPGRARAYGWGPSSPGGLPPCRLRWVDSVVVPLEICRDSLDQFGRLPTASELCAVAREGDVCGGDSGGPLIHASGRLLGLVSWGPACGGGLPTVYADMRERG